MEWYYADGDKRIGPVSEERLRSLLAGGTIGHGTLVWNQSMSDWATLGSTGFSLGAGSPAVAGATGDMVRCAECGRMFPRSQVLAFRGSYVCGGCKNVFFQRVKEGGAAPGTFRYGGFWIRFVAKFLDGILQSLLVFLLTIPLGSVVDPQNEDAAAAFTAVYLLISYGIPLVYTTFFLGKFGATPGKMALGLKVVRPDGDRVTYLRAFGRWFGELLSGLIFSIGYIMAAFDDEKRALHDRICDTRVIRTR